MAVVALREALAGISQGGTATVEAVGEPVLRGNQSGIGTGSVVLLVVVAIPCHFGRRSILGRRLRR